MPNSSINIGINNQGKQLVNRIDLHFKNHELDYYKDYVLSASVELKDTKLQLSTIKKGEFAISEKDDIKDWFDIELYGEIKNLINNFAGSEISVNIILSVFDSTSPSQLKLLLEAIMELEESQKISGVNIKLFVILYDIEKIDSHQEILVSEVLRSLEQIVSETGSIIREIYYLDDRNVGQVVLNLNLDWLAFALGEFLVFQMINEKSGAALNKSRVFGLGVIHFNELLFRNVISNTILQYKFEQEGILEEGGVQIRDIINKCNPFIEGHQNFFSNFLDIYPFSQENSHTLTVISNTYIKEFKNELQQFITSDDYTIGESKALLANLLGEDDRKLEGIDWSGNRLDINDLEYDIVDYFNKYLEEKDQVKFDEQKELRGEITELSQGIKKDEKNIKKLEEQSKDIYRDLVVSFVDGVFSVDGKRINASGYIPSPISPNDEIYSYSDEAIPDTVDLSKYFPAVKDQGELPSCTAFPIAAVYEFFAKRNNKTVNISELFIYYNARDLNDDGNNEIGATLLATIQAVKEKGACHSKSHPYRINSFKDKPTEEAYIEAQHQVVNKAARININEKDFKQAIANGHPVIIGLKLFKSFYPESNSGVVPFPSEGESGLEKHGEHALLIVGFNDDEKLFKLRNSWGKEFGDNGYCYAPYDYIANPNFCLEAFVITDIVDLSFNEFIYDNQASFSFLRDGTLRKKIIKEYYLRAKKLRLTIVKKDHDDLAFQNEENAAKIKDSIFRKKLFNKLKEESDRASIQLNTGNSEIKKSKKAIYFTVGVIVAIGSGILFLTSLLPDYAAIVGAIIGLIIIVYGWWNASSVVEIVNTVQSNGLGDEDKYAFEAADNLFEVFEDMNQELIKRYKAISKYYTEVKNWQVESEDTLKRIEYDSPDFVINVIKKEPLLEYLENEKLSFLNDLPNLLKIFNKSYKPKTNNIFEVFGDLKSNYLEDINKNIENILDISLVEYIQGEKEYLYFEPAPLLSNTISNIQQVSAPFCNIKQTASSLDIQNYVIHEKIASNEDRKLNEFTTHRGASIAPILTFRNNNRKKYVAIQVAALDSIKDLVSYGL